MAEEKVKTIGKTEVLQLPKEEQSPWALLTGAQICFAVGLLALLEGMGMTNWQPQIEVFIAAVVVFCFGGYLMHSYNRWLARYIRK